MLDLKHIGKQVINTIRPEDVNSLSRHKMTKYEKTWSLIFGLAVISGGLVLKKIYEF